MEFYCAVCLDILEIFLFQFPTGWNSTLGDHTYAVVIGGFNSQRDGILLDFSLKLGVFFFVSIPNGMEFYSSRFFGRLYIESFNSQRDGILPNLSALISMELKRVSIPNGMEFYGAVLRIGAGVRQSFNSQRDGILLSLIRPISLREIVSIPNGMEFYVNFQME